MSGRDPGFNAFFGMRLVHFKRKVILIYWFQSKLKKSNNL